MDLDFVATFLVFVSGAMACTLMLWFQCGKNDRKMVKGDAVKSTVPPTGFNATGSQRLKGKALTRDEYEESLRKKKQRNEKDGLGGSKRGHSTRSKIGGVDRRKKIKKEVTNLQNSMKKSQTKSKKNKKDSTKEKEKKSKQDSTKEKEKSTKSAVKKPNSKEQLNNVRRKLRNSIYTSTEKTKASDEKQTPKEESHKSKVSSVYHAPSRRKDAEAGSEKSKAKSAKPKGKASKNKKGR
uniref:Uncharacterized protein n=1 Tax=Bursaphelenchus xylophilus TaxID=6326 RepID=A0A1I7RWL8_BURXY